MISLKRGNQRDLIDFYEFLDFQDIQDYHQKSPKSKFNYISGTISQNTSQQQNQNKSRNVAKKYYSKVLGLNIDDKAPPETYQERSQRENDILQETSKFSQRQQRESIKSLDFGSNQNNQQNDFFQFNQPLTPTIKQAQIFKIEKKFSIFTEKIILSLLNNNITNAEIKGQSKVVMKCKGSLTQNQNQKKKLILQIEDQRWHDQKTVQIQIEKQAKLNENTICEIDTVEKKIYQPISSIYDVKINLKSNQNTNTLNQSQIQLQQTSYELPITIINFRINAKIIKELPLQINYIHEIQDSQIFHLQYAINDKGQFQNLINFITCVSFELWFESDPKSKKVIQLPQDFIQQTQNQYMIEQISPQIVKITLKPKIQKQKSERARQVFDKMGELIIPFLPHKIKQVRALIQTRNSESIIGIKNVIFKEKKNQDDSSDDELPKIVDKEIHFTPGSNQFGYDEKYQIVPLEKICEIEMAFKYQ